MNASRSRRNSYSPHQTGTFNAAIFPEGNDAVEINRSFGSCTLSAPSARQTRGQIYGEFVALNRGGI